MRRILFVALAFIILLHFVQITARRRTCRAKPPTAFRASPSLHARGFDPYQLSHESFLGLLLSPHLDQLLFTMKSMDRFRD
jgi:hypothetical protein